jgi:hypothetical protein
VAYGPSQGGKCRRGCGVCSVRGREMQEGMWRTLRHRAGGAGGDMVYAPSQGCAMFHSPWAILSPEKILYR